MADMHHYRTAISKILNSSTEEETIIRGHRLSDLIRGRSYVASAFLLLAGRVPTPGEERTLDALMTACVDHGITPAAMIGRAFASYGTPIAQAIAGSTLLYGDIAGGAGDPLAGSMKSAFDAEREESREINEAVIRRVAASLVRDALARSGGRVPGFGNPPHARDPRPGALLDVAREQGTAGIYCRTLVAMEREIVAVKGREIPINIDGIVAALVLDLGLPVDCSSALVMISRGFSVLAHYLEERSQNTRWRHVPQDCVEYTGPMPG